MNTETIRRFIDSPAYHQLSAVGPLLLMALLILLILQKEFMRATDDTAHRPALRTVDAVMLPLLLACLIMFIAHFVVLVA